MSVNYLSVNSVWLLVVSVNYLSVNSVVIGCKCKFFISQLCVVIACELFGGIFHLLQNRITLYLHFKTYLVIISVA